MPQTDQPSSLSEFVDEWAFQTFGIWGIAGLALLAFAFYVWSKWNDIRTWPGVSFIAKFLPQERLPKADPDRFSVAVAHLENDPNHNSEQLIISALRAFDGIQILRFDRTITVAGSIPEEREREGHVKARGYLEQSGASVLIWGSVLSFGGETKLSLFLTAPRLEPTKARQYTPVIETEFRLPQAFWSDLVSVLQLLVATRGSDFDSQRGRFIADDLRPFISRVRNLLAPGNLPSEWNTYGRAGTHIILANALSRLGQQAGEKQPLVEAVAAYRAALEELTLERVPLDWVTIQNNLGVALRTLGERERGTERLEEAVAAYRAALEVNTRERAALDWAMTQNNLGNALLTLGERESGTERLEDAVAAFRAVLEEYTRERLPLDWAMTQNNLGNALATLGARQSGTGRFEEAAAAYRAALEEYTRERAPLDWAMTQNNLGAVLARLGKRESGAERLEEAITAFCAALEEWTRERVPLDWAGAQNNLGNTLRALGERQSGTERLEEAVAAYRASLEVFEAAQASYFATSVSGNLEMTLAVLEGRRGE